MEQALELYLNDPDAPGGFLRIYNTYLMEAWGIATQWGHPLTIQKLFELDDDVLSVYLRFLSKYRSLPNCAYARRVFSEEQALAWQTTIRAKLHNAQERALALAHGVDQHLRLSGLEMDPALLRHILASHR
jgi:hypothetical protein